MVRETAVTPSHLIQPLFVVEGLDAPKDVPSMPGVQQLSIAAAVERAHQAHALGLGGIILFGIPARKDAAGRSSWKADGIVQKTTRAIKAELPEFPVIADLCFCEYTDHGHCGVLHDQDVDNDETLQNLGRQAVALAESGVDMLAPSGMMDGMVGAIREAIDEVGFDHLPIMSYAVKYASAFYGPFRDAAESAPSFGDRRTYQMDPANVREAMREAQLDLSEGADILMVKPGLAYLDIVSELRGEHDVPIAVYNVSGEMAMVEAAAEKGWIDRKRTILETLLSMRRAGADLILSYWSLEAAAWLK